MKIHIIVLLIYLFFSFTNISAQEKIISEQAMSLLRNNAAEKLKSKSYRVIMTSESYRIVTDSAPYYFTSQITEYTPPDNYHSIFEQKTADKTIRSETIKIGQRNFSRSNNEAWKEITENGSGSGSGSGYNVGSTIDNKKTVEYKYKGKSLINGRNADLYVIKTVRRYKLKDEEWTSVYIERFWFNEEGLFLKTEIESGYGKKVISHTVREYEYDPNIKIEAPVK